jgi:hypothetical protein
MCVGIACGGMTVTTIYSAASGEPVALIAGLAGIVTGILVVALLVKYDLISLPERSDCPGITF